MTLDYRSIFWEYSIVNWFVQPGSESIALTSNRVDASPHDDPHGLPWWERPWIPQIWHQAMFGAGQPVYWIADPVRYATAAPNSGLDSSRFRTTILIPEGMSELAPVMPRLIGPLDPELPDSIARHAVRECLGHRVGLFLVGEVTHDQLARHLQSFVMVPAADRGRLFFRFWDPEVALAFLRLNAGRPARIGRFLGVPGAGDLSLFAETGATEIEALKPAAALPRAPGSPDLDATECAGFERLHLDRFVRGAATWLVATYGSSPATPAHIEAAIHAQIEPLRAVGITSEYAVNYALAGLYILGIALADLPSDGRALLVRPEVTEDIRARDFLLWAQSHPARRPLVLKGEI